SLFTPADPPPVDPMDSCVPGAPSALAEFAVSDRSSASSPGSSAVLVSGRGLWLDPQPSQIRPAARSTAPLDKLTDSAITISSHGRPACSAAFTSSACPAEDT